MLTKQFWKQSPELYWAYQVSYEMKIERESEERNINAWLHGLYNYKAYKVVEYNLNKQQGDPVEEYFNKPIDFNEINSDIKIEQDRIDRQNALETSVKIMLGKSKNIIDKKKVG